MAQKYYEDEPPYRQFETRDEARNRLRDLVDSLSKSKDDRHRELARKLDGCTSDNPCLSGACPRCMRAARLNWIDAVVDLVENEWRR